MTRVAKPLPAPPESLQRLKSAAASDLPLARLTLALFQAILGREWKIVFPGYFGGLVDCRQFPARLRKDVRAVVDWALGRPRIELNAIYACIGGIQHNIIQMRINSRLGRHFLLRARRLIKLHPQLPKEKWDLSGTLFPVMQEELGKPLSERTILLASTLNPQFLQVVPHGAFMNSSWTPGVLTIRLDKDGYSVGEVSLAVTFPEQPVGSEVCRFEGELIDYFETGTEGVIWMLNDERHLGRGALVTLCEGDHLTVLDQLGKILWRGVIRCDKKIGWRKFPLNPAYGQQCALGYWVHWIQRSFKPDTWARFFIRRDYDRLRGILVRKVDSKKNPHLGPEPVKSAAKSR